MKLLSRNCLSLAAHGYSHHTKAANYQAPPRVLLVLLLSPLPPVFLISPVPLIPLLFLSLPLSPRSLGKGRFPVPALLHKKAAPPESKRLLPAGQALPFQRFLAVSAILISIHPGHRSCTGAVCPAAPPMSFLCYMNGASKTEPDAVLACFIKNKEPPHIMIAITINAAASLSAVNPKCRLHNFDA